MNIRAKIYRWFLSGYKRESESIKNQTSNQFDRKNSRSTTRMHIPATVDSGVSLDAGGIYFKVIPGSGGIAIEVSHYDRRVEQDVITLHIIPEGEELSEELAKIITLEAMKR